MAMPQSLLDALEESITSGTFIDTKFYVFSRRGASGRVDSPRSLYCNSHVLSTVPYFSALLSDRFSEGQIKDINEGFPSDSLAYNDSYDYFSDSDLEDESPCSGEREGCTDDDGPGVAPSAQDPGLQVAPPTVSGDPPQLSQDSREAENERSIPIRTGKVAIVPDMATVTFMAMIYFLYTGQVTFAPFKSNPCHKQLPVKGGIGTWDTPGPLPPSAKSIYRLADKYDIPTLKEQARAHIYENLEQCNIVDEVFSSFSHSFPEILSVQISLLVNKMKQESMGGFGSATKRQLEEKITGLTQSGLAHATDALVMIWNGVVGPLDILTPAPEPKSALKFTALQNWHRIKLALLKSILTGTFIDVQFYAYNAIRDNLPVDLKPLFTSSIIIEEWAPAIATQTVGIESQAGYMMDELTDDYEWHDERTEAQRKDKAVVKHRTEAISTTESREVVVLASGAWKTWLSLLSHSYTSETTFSPLQSSVPRGDTSKDAEVRWRRSCSPRSMYSLVASLGIENLKDGALKDIQSKLTTSNITQELFTSFTANHKAIMDIEIEFFQKSFTERNPTLLIEHIKRMASGEAPFFSKTLSLVYGRFVEKVFSPPILGVLESGPGGVLGAPGQKNKEEKPQSGWWGGEFVASVPQVPPTALETTTPAENQEGEFDWGIPGKKKKGLAASLAQSPSTPGPDNRDGDLVGGSGGAKKKKKRSTQPMGSDLSWF